MHEVISALSRNGWWGQDGFARLSIIVAVIAGATLGVRRLRAAGANGDRRYTLARTALDAALIGALALVFTMTVLPTYHWGGWDNLGRQSGGINLVPFDTIKIYLAWGQPGQVQHNLVYNVLLFVPLGWCLAVKARGHHPLIVATLGGALISGLVEAGQYVLPISRSTDVDDVILNTAGSLLGAIAALVILPALRWAAHGRTRLRNRITA